MVPTGKRLDGGRVQKGQPSRLKAALSLLVIAIVYFCVPAVCFGVGWGFFELSAGCLIVVAARRFQKPFTWFLEHRRVMFAIYIAVFAVAVFPLCSLFLAFLSPWWCLGIAIAVGLIVVMSVWQLQVAYWRSKVMVR